jgi:rod shape-determining protein MreC
VAAYQDHFFTRGPSPLARLTFFGLFAVAVMIADHRFQALGVLRQGVLTLLTPVELALMWPGKVGRDIGDYFIAQEKLLDENKALNDKVLQLSAEGQRAQLIAAEQEHIAALNAANLRFNRKGVVAEIIRDARNPFARKIVINRGYADGIKSGSAVIDGNGVVGQVTAIGATSAEVTLTTEKDQSIPVMVIRPSRLTVPSAEPPSEAAATTTPATDTVSASQRTATTRERNERGGLRAVAVGSGRDGKIELPFIPVAADIQVGDTLVTSGVDGTYPAGLSVATVTVVDKNPAFSFARIVASPATAPDHHRFVKVLDTADASYPQVDPAIADRAGQEKSALSKREAKLDAKRALRDR